jgi:hypothetical protein
MKKENNELNKNKSKKNIDGRKDPDGQKVDPQTVLLPSYESSRNLEVDLVASNQDHWNLPHQAERNE